MIYQQVDEEVSIRISQAEDFSETDSQTSEPGSPSLLAGLTTPTNRSAMNNENKVNDRFNGILYHVTPSEAQISVRFPYGKKKGPRHLTETLLNHCRDAIKTQCFNSALIVQNFTCK